eukprot:SAG31_NODE_1413_length_8459_cov_7.720215_1_plen_37_part_10
MPHARALTGGGRGPAAPGGPPAPARPVYQDTARGGGA